MTLDELIMGIESVTMNWEESEASGMTSVTGPRLEKTCGSRRTAMTAPGDSELASVACVSVRERMTTLFGRKCRYRVQRVLLTRLIYYALDLITGRSGQA